MTTYEVARPSRTHGARPASFAGGMETEIRTYIDIFRRRFKWAAWTVVLVVGAAFLYTVMQDPVYRASSLVEIRGGGDAPTVEALFAAESPTDEYLRTRYGLMTSGSLAERVIDELGLETHEEFNPELDAERRQIVNKFLARLVVDPVEESRLVRVNFDATSPELAAEIANAVVDNYAELRVASHEERAERVAGQADAVQERLASSEAELRAFAAANDLPFLVEEDLSAQISAGLGDLRTQLAGARAERFERESRYGVIVEGGRRDLMEDGALQALQLRLAELRDEYAGVTATFQDSYPAATQLRRQIENLESLMAEERGRLAQRVESEYQLALQREATLEQAIDSQEVLASELGPASGDYHILRQAVLANRNLYATLLDQRRQAEIVASIGSTDLHVVDRATPPLEPYSPVFAMNMGLALMLGLVLGVCMAFGREIFDNTVQTVEDFPISEEVPVLAMIPAIGVGDGEGSKRSGMLPWRSAQPSELSKGWHRMDNGHTTGRALTDSFGALRTAVLFKDDDDPLPRTILVTSCRAGEGKTTVSVNFAMSLAQLGHRVLLVDADLRKPSVHRAFGIEPGPGLVDCLLFRAPWKDVLQKSVAPKLDVLTSGGPSSRAGDLVAGPRLQPILDEAKEVYDYVVVDAPALFINAADARVLAQLVDGTVVVVRSRVTPRALVDRIPRAVPNVIGVVVNDLRKDSLPDYYSDYFAEYGEGDRDGSVSNGRRGAGRPQPSVKNGSNSS
ncbi:MAG TPA: polysaccharide biosynthesis tyrosine autokinase [Longimicrobiales bacterium]|nr:polysaccharide biosynthesis tyrosine autokinase [Longimicrobiales bacterium]